MVDKKLNNNKELSARLMAVQAYYQNSQNQKPMAEVVSEYLARGGFELDDGAELVKPHGGLFKKILLNLDSRLPEISEILAANINKKEVPIIVVKEEIEDGKEIEDNIEQKESKPTPEREVEPLLNAILLCGTSELLFRPDIDAALIIDDYLNVTHAFYEKQQVSFVNGVLDKLAKLSHNNG